MNLIIAKYDSISDRFLHPALESKYLKDKITFLDKIKPLTNEQKTSITNTFLYRRSDLDFKDRLKNAMQTCLKDTIYYAGIFKQEISQKSDEAVENFLVDRKIVLPLSSRKFINQYQRNLALMDYIYPTFNTEKRQVRSEIQAIFKTSIDSISLVSGFTFPDNSFANAYRYRKVLELNPQQVNQLIKKTLEITQEKEMFLIANPGVNYDSRSIERRQH